MDALGITFWTALLAGIATFFSPCIIPVLPGFFAFLGGTKSQTKLSRLKIFGATIVFVLGFSITFVLLGIGANFLGESLSVNRVLFEKIGGVLIICFGLFAADILPWKITAPTNGVIKLVSHSAYGLKNLLFGMTFGFAWLPCIGPILGTILFLATGEKTATEGGLLLFVFSLGIAVPMLLFSLITPELSKVLRKIKPFARFAHLFFAVIMIVLGVLLFFGKLETISGLLVEKLGTGFAF